MPALPLEDLGIPSQRTADLEVLPFDNPLHTSDLRAHNRVLERIWTGGANAIGEQITQAVSHHQVLLEAEVEARRAGIALPAGATPQLQVDTAAFMTIGADDIQAAGCSHLVVL